MAQRDSMLRRLEANPTRFFGRELDAALAGVLEPVAGAVGGRPEELTLVPNTTYGINLVARSLLPALGPGDELLVTDAEYGAQFVLWEWVARQSGATLNMVPVVGLPPESVADVVEAAVTGRTRVALISHITSSTALRLPVEEVAPRLRAHGVVVIVDGAHAPGHLPLDVATVGADYYVANLHKWFAAPRSAAFVHASPAAQAAVDPLVISWGGTDRSAPLSARAHVMGTADVSGWLAVPDALAFHRDVLAPARPAARALLAAAAARLADRGYERLGRQDDDLLMASFWLPAGRAAGELSARLTAERIEAIVTGHQGRSILRVAVAWYVTEEDVDRLLVVA